MSVLLSFQVATSKQLLLVGVGYRPIHTQHHLLRLLPQNLVVLWLLFLFVALQVALHDFLALLRLVYTLRTPFHNKKIGLVCRTQEVILFSLSEKDEQQGRKKSWSRTNVNCYICSSCYLFRLELDPGITSQMEYA